MAFNPYVPTDSVPPEYFAGRKEILARAATLIENAGRGIHGGLLLCGHRGIGKTSALRAAEALLPPKVPVVRVRFSRKCSLAEFAAEVVGHVRAETKSWKSLFGVGELEVPFLTVRMDPRAPTDVTPHVALLELLQSLRRVKTMWLSLDDLDYVQGDALSLVKSAMEVAKAPTLVLGVAGGPDLRERLVSEHSPIIRFFTGSDFDLVNLSLEETREALELPIHRNRIQARWSPSAVEEVYRSTGGYPYLVQCLAAVCFQGGEIDVARVKEVKASALRQAGTWMEREIRQASDRDIQLFDKVGRGGKNQWRASELTAAGVDAIYVRRLVRLGVLRRVVRGQYVVVKPPMIARYHLWKRGLAPLE